MGRHSELSGQEVLGNRGDGVHSGQAHDLGPDHSGYVRRGTAGGGPKPGRSWVEPKECLELRIKPL